ncbi:MAG: hypothetical protein KBD78_12375 [Oligoflexales bacterium]|nr:hypothetical protein [Oligoflexales bacterium]
MNIIFNVTRYCVFSVLVTTPLKALPSYYESRWPESGIKNESSALLMRDSESENRIWVLPPSVGQAKILNFSLNADVIACDSYTATLKSQNQLMKEIAEQRLVYLTFLDESNDIYTKKSLLLDEVASIKNTPDYILLENLKDKRLRLESERDQALANYKQEIKAENRSAINDVLIEEFLEVYRKRTEDLEALEVEISQFELKLASAFASIASNQERIKNLENEIYELDNRLKKIQSYLDAAIRSMQELLSIYKDINAGSLSIEYDSLWSDTLKKLRKDYPKFQFSSIETRNALLYVAAGNQDREYGASHGVLAYSINGISGKTNKNGAVSLPMVADEISADFVITLDLACPMLKKDDFLPQAGVDADLKISAPQFALTMTYEFPMTFSEDISANVDIDIVEAAIWQKINDKGSSKNHINLKDFSLILEAPLFKQSFDFNDSTFEPESNKEHKANFQKEFLFDHLTRNFQPTLGNLGAHFLPGENDQFNGWSPSSDFYFKTLQTQTKPMKIEKSRNKVNYRSGVIAFKYK